MKIKSILKSTMFTLLVAGFLPVAVNAQNKPANKSSKKDTVKKAVPVRAPGKNEKNEVSAPIKPATPATSTTPAKPIKH
ncbi:hypothetical protein EV200_102295 [Pedobacter psychrotolerans]|uniref:Uncharacterized protein n=1 Tax=Pedobacter psychrotolerans TaxID=1843235 RepID=A0A4R2HKA3_9SPHI|nr:hypothetical protein [Pedobacter psychrotolerans]TCO28878.1 hypothetical protein EV200_102295 [Pedobacter psychrotolerans]GGE52538.1 hypothetical protein GCM10011413_18510 [Pedobacter psychrotolerans]